MTPERETHCVDQIPLPLCSRRLLLNKERHIHHRAKTNGWGRVRPEPRELPEIDGRTATERIDDSTVRHVVRTVINAEIVTKTA